MTERHYLRSEGAPNLSVDHDSMIANEAILSCQFFDRTRQSADEPERRLLVAVLELGIRDWIGRETRSAAMERKQREAERWIFGDYETAGFSFQGICETLDLDPDYIRAQLDKVPQNSGARFQRSSVRESSGLRGNLVWKRPRESEAR